MCAYDTDNISYVCLSGYVFTQKINRGYVKRMQLLAVKPYMIRYESFVKNTIKTYRIVGVVCEAQFL